MNAEPDAVITYTESLKVKWQSDLYTVQRTHANPIQQQNTRTFSMALMQKHKVLHRNMHLILMYTQTNQRFELRNYN